MKAMVLAAGKGTRFRPFNRRIPKPMIDVGGKPVLERVIDHLRRYGIRDIVINLHYLPEAIRGYFGDGRRWGISIRYSFESELLGTAGAVRRVAHEFRGTFLVYYGDNLCSCNLARLREFHKEKGGIATIVVAESYDEIPGGIVDLRDDGLLVRFLEKPRSAGDGKRMENAGVYVFERAILDYIPPEGPSDFGKDVFPRILREGGRIFCYRAEGFVRGLDTPERYRRVINEVEEGRLKLK